MKRKHIAAFVSAFIALATSASAATFSIKATVSPYQINNISVVYDLETSTLIGQDLDGLQYVIATGASESALSISIVSGVTDFSFGDSLFRINLSTADNSIIPETTPQGAPTGNTLLELYWGKEILAPFALNDTGTDITGLDWHNKYAGTTFSVILTDLDPSTADQLKNNPDSLFLRASSVPEPSAAAILGLLKTAGLILRKRR